MISGISGAIPGASSSLFGAPARTASKEVGRDEFLKLLTTQMKYQNPLDPIKDAEFVAQLAQFSTLEGMQKLNTSFNDMLLLQGLTQGSSLIGKTVAYERRGEAAPATGVVEAVKVENGKLMLVVGSESVDLNQVRAVVANAKK